MGHGGDAFQSRQKLLAKHSRRASRIEIELVGKRPPLTTGRVAAWTLAEIPEEIVTRAGIHRTIGVREEAEDRPQSFPVLDAERRARSRCTGGSNESSVHISSLLGRAADWPIDGIST